MIGSSVDVEVLLDWLPAAPLFVAGLSYGLAVRALHRRGDRWPLRRSVAAAAGVVLLAVALLPPLAAHDERFEVHVIQHLLLASCAPLLLALSAPVTLALRVLPTTPRRAVVGALHSPLVRRLTSPIVIVALEVGSLYGFYLTGAFGAAEDHPLLHVAVHTHMLMVGCLLSWYLVGVDPMPRRPGLAPRVVVLVAVAGAHDVLAKLMYAHGRPVGAGTTSELHRGAQLFYYGGDVIELALAVVLLAGWYATGRRELAHADRRAAATSSAS